MKRSKGLEHILCLSLISGTSTMALAADYLDGDIHKNDYKWMQFNLMYAIDELPTTSTATEDTHDYLEMEFGGRSGIWSLYGYVDVFNLTNRDNQDKSSAPDKMFMKFVPRASLDAITGSDLSFGPVKELYIASEFNWGGNNNGVNNSKFGIGSDVEVPWLGTVGLNLYSTYDTNAKDWNGYQLSTNWFKPFYFFENGSFISYQGYIDWQFDMNGSASAGGTMFNGLYWHSDRYAIGYGLKGYKNIYGLKDGANTGFGGTWDSTGFAHYLSATYKF